MLAFESSIATIDSTQTPEVSQQDGQPGQP